MREGDVFALAQVFLINWCEIPDGSRCEAQEVMLLYAFKSQEGSFFFSFYRFFFNHLEFVTESVPILHFIGKEHCTINSNQSRWGKKKLGHGWNVEARGSDHIICDQIWIFISMPVVNRVKLQLRHWLTLHQYSTGPFYAWELLENWMLNKSVSYCTESDERVRECLQSKFMEPFDVSWNNFMPTSHFPFLCLLLNFDCDYRHFSIDMHYELCNNSKAFVEEQTCHLSSKWISPLIV